jgi:hypothetical protein
MKYKLADLLNEIGFEKIYHVGGILIVDPDKRNQKDILSDIRALPGITIVRNIEMEQDTTSRYFRSTLEIKVDPYPYVKQNKFDSKATIEKIINNIKNVNGVIGFKQTTDTYSTND